MDKKDVKKIISYWIKTAEHDYEVMITLFENKRYDYALFFGHIVLEKILKAIVVNNTNNEAPKTHDLVSLAELARLDLHKDELEYLKIINRFNMRARYPDVKFNFYKLCDYKYTKDHLAKIKKLYKNLCQTLTLKK